ncbi:uncharacterized protein BDR25DRAFT_394838 [Lindgomyces ingoldianus]|uniref:Uncharacterized protein n=1 Tax=Lindgomyces ingoldianus TaxID=673940 RepID=A0ACB6QN64_9PLEO|nr:uncharacterized protein BDR25DRAFT_394838 [Lindgomyces ingoldianus]KAF2468330.1 hypothetical protein BDR25DRAFT_394838 [Lindgomyces ingoldianus]
MNRSISGCPEPIRRVPVSAPTLTRPGPDPALPPAVTPIPPSIYFLISFRTRPIGVNGIPSGFLPHSDPCLACAATDTKPLLKEIMLEVLDEIKRIRQKDPEDSTQLLHWLQVQWNDITPKTPLGRSRYDGGLMQSCQQTKLTPGFDLFEANLAAPSRVNCFLLLTSLLQPYYQVSRHPSEPVRGPYTLFQSLFYPSYRSIFTLHVINRHRDLLQIGVA